MAKHRTHSIEFKRQIAQDFIAGETLHASPTDTTSRASSSESGCGSLKLDAFDDDAQAADLLQDYEAKIAALAIRRKKNSPAFTASAHRLPTPS